ncbi:MAG TPA: PhnD/SsuA/transferrin family substrate-binding protein [bacterium]|nr:PhnD/SsuA/transferrin family substrate-binding protein [bacterium]
MKNTFPEANPKDAQAAFEIWVKNYLKETQNKIRVKIVSTVFEDIDSLTAALEKKEIEFININTMDYFRIKEKMSISPILVTAKQHSPTEKLLLLCSKDNNIKNVTDLVNKKIIAQKGKWDAIPAIWLETLLIKETNSSYDMNLIKLDKASQCVYNLYFKQADACIVSANAYSLINELNPKICLNVKVLAESPDYLPFIFCHTDFADKNIIKLIKSTAFNFENSSYGKQILTLFQSQKNLPVKDIYLKEIKILYDTYQRFLSENKIKKIIN